MKYFKVIENNKEVAWAVVSDSLVWGVLNLYLDDDQAFERLDEKIELLSDGNVLLLEEIDFLKAFDFFGINIEEISEQDWDEFQSDGRSKFVRFVKDWGDLQY